MKIYLGVDPGLSGGLAAISEAGHVLNTIRMPSDPAAIINYLLALRAAAADSSVDRVVHIRAALEFVRSSPQQGVASAFTFGRGYGRLEVALAACRIPTVEVHPLRWQRLLDCRTGGDKNISKARAAELFPGVIITHANADALLLAEYRRRLGVGIAFHELTPTPAHRLRSFVHSQESAHGETQGTEITEGSLSIGEGKTRSDREATRRGETDRQLAEVAYGKDSRLNDPQVRATIAGAAAAGRPRQTDPSARRRGRGDR